MVALLGLAVLLPPVRAFCADGSGEPRRLYDGLAAYVPNPDGAAFTVLLEVRDLNHQSRAPSELMVKILDPDGRILVREVLPDDGLTAPEYAPPAAGWDHEAWYYAASRSRGIEPMVSWSHFTDPAYLGKVPVRPFSFSVPAGPAGVYRILLFGGPDHVVKLNLTPALTHAVAGTVNWLHGHGAQYRRSFLYVPRGAKMLYLSLLENDLPASRTLTLRDSMGNPIALRKSGPEEATNAPPGGLPSYGLTEQEAWFAAPGALDDQVLTLDVSEGTGAFLVLAAFQMGGETPTKRLKNVVNALFAPDAATAKAVQGGAIYHDGRTFWHPFQVRYHDWLKTLTPGDLERPAGLPVRPDFHSVGSHQSPAKDSADRLMHDYPAHRNRQALNLALREMASGLNAIGPGDMVVQGPMKNLAYEMGCYSFFYHRPAWRILQESDAPDSAKGPIREFILTVGDRLAFCRGGELINGNALASLVEALRYCAEASRDPLQASLFDTYWDRFAHGGFGDRIGIGPSGAIQESFGYDHNYGSYVLRGWRAVNVDLKDPRFLAAYDRVQNLYSYTYSEGVDAAPWSSRTEGGTAGGTYSSTNGAHRWKGYGGPDFTESVNGANEFFAARRAGYYALTYHGRLTPTWFNEGFHGQVGYGGGMLCQLSMPAKGTVLASTLNGAYGAGMHPSQWRNFHIHSLVGTTPDGQPLVTANSEQSDARLEGTVVSSSGEVRQSSVRVFRRFDFQPDRIVCEVRLAPSQVEALFDLYGGRSEWRGRVGEVWEMIPFANAPVKRRGPQSPQTRLTALDASGRVLGPVGTSNLVDAAAVEIDRHGFGCRVALPRLMPVMRGSNDTLLIQLAGEPTPASEVALTYTLIPYIGPSALEQTDTSKGL
jgi:hypothetical protein